MRLHTVLIILTLTGIMTVSVMDYFCNARTLGKIRDSFSNWKDGINNEADLMAKLKKAAENS